MAIGFARAEVTIKSTSSMLVTSTMPEMFDVYVNVDISKSNSLTKTPAIFTIGSTRVVLLNLI